jgi:hypothetical protein
MGNLRYTAFVTLKQLLRWYLGCWFISKSILVSIQPIDFSNMLCNHPKNWFLVQITGLSSALKMVMAVGRYQLYWVSKVVSSWLWRCLLWAALGFLTALQISMVCCHDWYYGPFDADVMLLLLLEATDQILKVVCAAGSTLSMDWLGLTGTSLKHVLHQDKAAFIRLTGISVLQSVASAIVAPSLRSLSTSLGPHLAFPFQIFFAKLETCCWNAIFLGKLNELRHGCCDQTVMLDCWCFCNQELDCQASSWLAVPLDWVSLQAVLPKQCIL